LLSGLCVCDDDLILGSRLFYTNDRINLGSILVDGLRVVLLQQLLTSLDNAIISDDSLHLGSRGLRKGRSGGEQHHRQHRD
jgi:hypothetical protein